VICCHESCMKPATHEVRLCVPCADGSTTAEGPLGFELCAEHSSDVEDWEFDSIQWALEYMLPRMGIMEPAVHLAYARAVPVTVGVVN